LIIADTGFWLALANVRDRHHERAKQALSEIAEPLITTWPVLTETCHLLAARLGSRALERFVAAGAGGAYELFSLQRSHLARVEALMRKYRDLPMDLADASLVILAEEAGSGRILSTDVRDFRTYRWKNRKPFTNLLELE
jgi:predicted nucleic acid-binding protein